MLCFLLEKDSWLIYQSRGLLHHNSEADSGAEGRTLLPNAVHGITGGLHEGRAEVFSLYIQHAAFDLWFQGHLLRRLGGSCLRRP